MNMRCLVSCLVFVLGVDVQNARGEQATLAAADNLPGRSTGGFAVDDAVASGGAVAAAAGGGGGREKGMSEYSNAFNLGNRTPGHHRNFTPIPGQKCVYTTHYGCIIPNKVHRPVTYAMIAVLVVVTMFILVRVGRIWRYGHRKLSFAHLCYILLLIWSIMRTTLLALYATPEHNNSIADNLGELPYMLLYVVPPLLQYLTCSLLALYFCQVCIHAAATPSRRDRYNKIAVAVTAATNIVGTVLGVSGAIHFHHLQDVNSKEAQKGIKDRVIITEMFNVFLCTMWMLAVLQLRRLINTKQMIEGHGMSMKQAIVVTVAIVCLLFTRLVFNMVAISQPNIPQWDFDLSFLSDHADRSRDDTWAFIFMVIAMFLWEILPTLLVVRFFSVPTVDYKALKEVQGLSAYETEPILFNSEDEGDSDTESLDGSRFAPISNASGIGVHSSNYGFWQSSSLGRDGINTSRSSYYDTGQHFVTPPNN